MIAAPVDVGVKLTEQLAVVKLTGDREQLLAVKPPAAVLLPSRLKLTLPTGNVTAPGERARRVLESPRAK